MGTIYRPKYTAADGTRKEAAVWWLRYRQGGKTIRHSTDTTDRAQALEKLRQQEGKVALKIPVNVQADRLTLADGAQLIRQDYTKNGKKSAVTLEYRIAPLLRHLGERTRLARIVTGTVETYQNARLAEGIAPGTVNRETTVLLRMASLARRQYGLVIPFVVTTLAERNARQGFFETDAFQTVLGHLPPHLAALAEAGLLTGWRRGELLSRQWTHVDMNAGWLRLEPGETKNGKGRQFPIIPALRAVLDARWAQVELLQLTTGRTIPWVFCQPDGAPIRCFRRAWRTAVKKAGVPGRIFHDLRRTAVRNLERAGVSRSAAMAMTGHETESIYRRYAIVDEGTLREAGAKLAGQGRVLAPSQVAK